MKIPELPEMDVKCVGLYHFPILPLNIKATAQLLHFLCTNGNINDMLISARDSLTAANT